MAAQPPDLSRAVDPPASAAPADALPVVHIVNPDNPRTPSEDSKDKYMWVPELDGDWARIEDLYRHNYSYTCKGPEGYHWWRREKPAKVEGNKDNPMLPRHDVDNLFQWAALNDGTSQQVALLNNGYSFTIYEPSSSLLMFRKRREVAESADGADGVQPPKRARRA